MADRNVNININYRVNTADIEKLTGAVTRANQATTNLQSSATNLGTRGRAATQPYIRSIESVRQEMQRTRALIDVTARSDTKLLNERIAKYRQLKGEVDRFNRSVDGSGKAAQRSSGNFTSLANAVRTVFTVAVARQVVTMTLDMARLSGNVDGVDKAFRRAFPNAELLMADLREHTHGAINDFVLMQRTLQATNLGVSVEHLAVLFEFAAVRAQQTGESVDYLVDSIVRGIGRKSALVLDNLGISTTRLKEEFNGAAIASQSVGDVTAAVARIAGQELDKMGGFAENAATKVSQLEVAFFDTRKALADLVTQGGGFIDFLTEAVNAVGEFIKARGSLLQVGFNILDQGLKEQAIKDATLVIDKAANKELVDRIDFVQQEINSRVQLSGRYNDQISRIRELIGLYDTEVSSTAEILALNEKFRALYKETFGITKDINKETVDGLNKQLQGYLVNQTVIGKTNDLLLEYLDTIRQVAETVPDAKLPGFIQEVEKQIADLNERIEGSRNEENIKKWEQAVFLLQGRLHELKTLGLPEFKSPEVLERVGKIIDEKIKKGFEDSTIELLKMEDVLGRLEGQLQNLADNPIQLSSGPAIRQMDFFDALGESINEARTEIATAGIDITNNFLQESMAAEVEAFSMRIDLVRSFYDEQILLAGDNERAKQQLRLEEQRKIDDLRRQRAAKEKAARRFSVIVDTAASIGKTAAQLGFPAAIPFIALAIANGALQLSAINKAQPTGFAKGKVGIGGPGTSTSDSIPAMLSRGESVISADATRKSFHLLKAINGRKVDDRILQDLSLTTNGVKAGPPVDTDRIVAASDRLLAAIQNSQPDLIRIGANIYEAKKSRANFKRYVRSKSMGK
jgi:hypothetical protein